MKTITIALLFLLLHSFVFATTEKKSVKVRMMAPSGYSDETTIYFDVAVTTVYTATEDGPKVYSTIANAPNIYSMSSDNVLCSTNGYSVLSESEIVPLGIKTDTAGIYVFTASLLNNFDATSILQLEDRQANVFTDLRNDSYSVQLEDSLTNNARFFLHVSRAIQFSSTIAGCANNDGEILVQQDNALVWTSANLFDSIGYPFGSFTNVSGSYSFNNLPEGNFNLVLTYGNYITTKILHVNGNVVVAHIQPSSITAMVNEEITFHAIAHNATAYQWDLGDDTWIGGVVNPAYAYTATGVYKVFLTCTNSAGCTYRDSVLVTILNATAVNEITNSSRNISSHAKIITVVLSEEITQGAEIKIYNLLGQTVYQNAITDYTTQITLSEMPTGYYLVSLMNDKNISTKRIFVGK